jgi:DNA-binding MarR family transcriptional regulator
MSARTTPAIDHDLIGLLIAIKHIAAEEFHTNRVNTKTPLLAFQTLHYIHAKKQVVMKDIAHLFCITPPSATSLVKTLLKQKLVTHKTDPRDRRKTVLTVTPTGARLLATEHARMTKNITKIFSVLSPSDRATLVAVLKKMVAAHTTQ